MAIPSAAVSAAGIAFYSSTAPLAYDRVEEALQAAAPAMRDQAMLACAEGLESCGFTEAAALLRDASKVSRGDFEAPEPAKP